MTHAHRRRRQPLPSADMIAGNDDLMTEILIRLPAKSLCRFKSVSKRWYSLISHPNFSLLRMSNSVSGLFLSSIGSRAKKPVYKFVHLAGKRTRSAPFKSLTFVHDPLGIRIMHSCNGLLLCSSSGYSRNPNYYIYNPTTKQFAIIPPLSDDAMQAVPAMNLAFDPSRSPHFKIVLVHPKTPPIGSWTYQIEIYSSETGAWRLSGDSFSATVFQDFRNGVFLNDTIHWLSRRSETSLYFDVGRERFHTMPLPPIQEGSDKRSVGYFGESGGHLHLICSYDYSVPFDVLEMESDYSKWSVKYRVHLDVAIPTTYPECSYFNKISILHLVRGEMEEESSLVLYIPGMIVSYNFKDKKLKKLCNLVLSRTAEIVLRLEGWLCIHQHIETLIRF